MARGSGGCVIGRSQSDEVSVQVGVGQVLGRGTEFNAACVQSWAFETWRSCAGPASCVLGGGRVKR